MTDPAAGMAVIANIQANDPTESLKRISEATGVSLHRLRSIRNGASSMLYREQLMLEGLLPDERVAKLRETWCNTYRPQTFWEKQFTKGE